MLNIHIKITLDTIYLLVYSMIISTKIIGDIHSSCDCTVFLCSLYVIWNVNVNISLFGLLYSTLSPCDSPLTNTIFCMQRICYICTDKCNMGCLCYNMVYIFSVHATC